MHRHVPGPGSPLARGRLGWAFAVLAILLLLPLALSPALAVSLPPGLFSGDTPPWMQADRALEEAGLPVFAEIENSALAESMRENDAFQDVLREMGPLFQPMAGGDGGFEPAASADEAGPRQLAAAGNPVSLETQAAGALDDGGLTLRQVLAAIAPPASERSAGAADPAEQAEQDESGAPDLEQMLLDSRIIGSIAARVVAVDSLADTFSFFGAGGFLLEKQSDTVTVFDANNNFSLSISMPRYEDDYDDDDAPPAPQRPAEVVQHVNIVDLVLSYLDTPAGIMGSIVAGTLLLVWSAARAAIRR